MLRKRSRQVTSKQVIVSDQQTKNQWISLENQTKNSSFFLTSPRFFKGFFNSSNKIDPMMSPTSILDTNPFSIVSNLWVFDNNKSSSNNQPNKQQQQHAWEQPNNKQGISLALVDENNGSNTNDNDTKQEKRKLVVFGSQLRIQIPSIRNSLELESPREFGIKTPRNNLWPFGGNNKNSNSQVHPESSSEIIDEQSEDYTCVISHGPNPKTTHIFGNCIVENCCGTIVGSTSSTSSSFSSKRNNNGCFSSFGNSISSQVNFLSFCHHCNKKLGQGRDIFMYRGEKAFCSEECRCQEMLFDGVEN